MTNKTQDNIDYLQNNTDYWQRKILGIILKFWVDEVVDNNSVTMSKNGYNNDIVDNRF